MPLLPRATAHPWRYATALLLSLLGIQLLSPAPERLRVRLLWIRHGLSCANVLNACAAHGQAPP